MALGSRHAPMKHHASPDDRSFRADFEALEVEPSAFDHVAHVRLAYVYLCEHPLDAAAARMKGALLAFLAHLGVGESKYHETITRARVMAVDHFMDRSESCSSYADLVRQSPQLLDRTIMLTHYSAELLFSPGARHAFVAPDIQSILPT